ncbi:MAG: antibiotic biosynthesis monooxygenase family protein [Myxococcota bacterium]
MPIEEFIRYRVPPGSGPALEAAYRRAADSLDASPHCLDYAMHRCIEESGRYILRITWTSKDAHLGGFRKSEEFASFPGEVRPFIEHIEEMQHYEATSSFPAPRSTKRWGAPRRSSNSRAVSTPP